MTIPLPSFPGLISFIITVPLDVPSDFHNSSPTIPSLAANSNSFPRLTKASGKLEPPPLLISWTREILSGGIICPLDDAEYENVTLLIKELFARRMVVELGETVGLEIMLDSFWELSAEISMFMT